MNTRDDDIVISLKKVLFNLRRYFYVVIIAVVVSLLIDSALTVVSVVKGGSDESFTSVSTIQIHVPHTEGIDPLIIEGQKIVDEFNVYLSAEGVSDKLDQKLQEAEYEAFSSDDMPEFSATNNIITMQVSGDVRDRTAFISELLFDEFTLYVQSFDKGIDCTVLDNSVTKDVDEHGILNKIFSRNNILILILGFIIGFVIIGIVIFFDDRIYVVDDLAFCDGLCYLYTVDNKNKSGEIADKIIAHYVKGEKSISLVSCKASSKYDSLKKDFELITVDKLENIQYLDDVNTKVLLFIASGEDTKKEILNLINLIKSLQKEIVGFIFFE